jgi:two-component system sensor histidine kinase/response regulator
MLTGKSRLLSQLRSILVIEDDAQDYLLETRNLSQDGFPMSSITRATCVSEAAAILKIRRFDAILLDMNVGDSTGLETFISVYAMASDIPIVILSGVEGDQIASLAVSHGAQDFVLKKDLLSISLKKTLEFATERNEMLTALKKSREEAQRHTEFKSRFLAQMSHEIRTPMNGVIGIAQLLNLSPNLSEDDKELVNSLKATSKHLIDLISDILDLSKIEAGKTVLEEVPFNLRDLVEDSLRSLVPIAEEKDLVIADLIDPKIASKYRGDLNHLRQILLNLLSNALKFTKQGMITVSVEVSGESTMGLPNIKFSVRDTGRGIAREKISDLFKPFSQVMVQNEAVIQGTGLGLSICKALVELMGGKIGADSEVGVGSTFWFMVPLVSIEGKSSVRSDFSEKKAHIYTQNPNRYQILAEQMKMRGLIPIHIQSLEGLHDQEEDILLIDMPSDPKMRSDFIENSVPQKMNTLFLCRVSDRDKAMEGRSKVNGALLQQEIYQELGHFKEVSKDIKRKKSGDETMSEDLGLKNRKAMVVDDNKLNRDVANRMLKVLGLKAELFEDAQSAIEALRGSTFDVILMDCKMPVMDGFQATQFIRAQVGEPFQHIPIIALTANAFAEDKEKCLASGMNGFMSKPLMFKDLIAVLKGAFPEKEVETMSMSSPILNEFSTLPCIDDEVIDNLKELEDPSEEGAFVNGLIQTFNEDAPLSSAQMLESFRSHSLAGVEHYSHKLKGLSRNLGAVRLSEICNRIEKMSGTEKRLPPEELVLLIDKELNNVMNALSKHFVLKAAS